MAGSMVYPHCSVGQMVSEGGYEDGYTTGPVDGYESCPEYYPGGPYSPTVPYSHFTGPYPMGDGGTCPPVGYDLMGDVGMEGPLVDQRGPHYWDFRLEAVFLERDEAFGPNILFTREGVAPTGIDRLSSNQLQYDTEPGFRVMGRYDIGPLSVFEFGYTGVFDFSSEATAVDTNPPDADLFSLWSNFGDDNAFTNVTQPGGPGQFSERAQQHSIEITSDVQSAELSYRRYWVGWHPRVSGTLLAGFRYTKLDEHFLFSTLGSENVPFNDPLAPLAALDYRIDADNDLAGFQTGADMWVGLIQGLRFGVEGKVGLYGNHYTLETEVETTPPGIAPPSLSEEFEDDQAAFIGELSIDLVADILPSWSVRMGYEVLVIDSIVLAGDNFNTGSPYNPGPVDNGLGPVRVPFAVDQSKAVFSGGHIGVEFIW
jgi:hypothetical protein